MAAKPLLSQTLVVFTHHFRNHSRLSALMLIGAPILLLGACGKSTEPPKAPPPVAVSTLTVAPHPVPIQIEVMGRTEGSKEVEVRARVSGILERVHFQEGAPVKAGTSLFQIERAPFENALMQAKGSLAQEQARLDQTRREWTRLQPLVAKRAISQKEADDAATALRQSEANVQAADARVKDAELNLGYTRVSAPISGITGRSLRSEGSLVTPGSDAGWLTTLTQTDPIWIRLSLSESEYSVLRAAESTGSAKALSKPAGVQVKVLDGDGKSLPVTGQLNFTGSSVDSKLGTVQLRASLPNPDLTILPGQFLKTQLVIGQREAITVPQSAVQQNDQGRFVWVIGPESKAMQRKVEAGAWVGSDWVISSGLKPGDKVIVDNLIRLRPGSVVSETAPAENAGKAQGASSGAMAPAPASKAAAPTVPATPAEAKPAPSPSSTPPAKS